MSRTTSPIASIVSRGLIAAAARSRRRSHVAVSGHRREAVAPSRIPGCLHPLYHWRTPASLPQIYDRD
jgi:hypothetical protein